jgi:hypothetical protein
MKKCPVDKIRLEGRNTNSNPDPERQRLLDSAQAAGELGWTDRQVRRLLVWMKEVRDRPVIHRLSSRIQSQAERGCLVQAIGTLSPTGPSTLRFDLGHRVSGQQAQAAVAHDRSGTMALRAGDKKSSAEMVQIGHFRARLTRRPQRTAWPSEKAHPSERRTDRRRKLCRYHCSWGLQEQSLVSGRAQWKPRAETLPSMPPWSEPNGSRRIGHASRG